jgi:hypothetical protein
VAVTSAENPYAGQYLATLATQLHTRYEATGSAEDLAEALTEGRRAVTALGPRHPDGSRARSTLALVLQACAGHSTSPEALDEAADLARQALRSADEKHRPAGTFLNNLATILQDRSVRRAALEDLDEAIALLRRSAALSTGTGDEPVALSNLCAALSNRFEVTGDPQDIHDSVAAGRDALARTDDDAWMRPTRLSNLSAALRTR